MPLPATLSSRAVKAVLAVSVAFLLPTPALRAEAPELKLKDGDVWVMAGDSITAQRQHTNYIEAYYRTRFPQLHLHFRNSGIGGNRTGNIIKRFDYDVAAWKPTIVSIELGMNDVGGKIEDYIKGTKELIGRIRAIPAQPVLISSSPVDDGSIMGDWRGARCESLNPFTDALKKLAAEENVLVVDQYHALIDLWGTNRRKGAELAAKNPPPPAPVATPAPPVAGATPAPPKPAPIPPSLIPLTGDTVHPGPVGQYTMATVILEGFKAPEEVSSATLSADGKVVESKRCQITEAAAQGGKITFTRLDEASPWPILPLAKSAATLLPDVLKLSQYQLRISGLMAEGSYQVNINGKPAAKVTGAQLGEGWNVTSAFDSEIGVRATAILGLIGKLQGPLNNEWRAASQASDTDKLAAAQKAIEATEAEIQTACQPVALHFEIASAPAK